MFNAVNNILKRRLIIASAFALALCGCGGGNEHKQAQSLLDDAKRQLDDNAPDSALALIDSLDKIFPAQIDIRREGMVVRANAMTLSLEKKIFETDSLIIVYQNEVNNLMPMFEHADVPGANGYYYMKGAYGPDISKSDGVQARLNDIDFTYYIVAANSGEKIGISQIILSSPSGSLSSAEIPDYDSRRGDTDKYGTDFATFSTSEADTLGAWAFNNGNITSVTVSGSLGSREFNLAGPKADQFGNAWRLSVLGAKLVTAKRLKEKLERQVIIARDHAVNLIPDQSDNK